MKEIKISVFKSIYKPSEIPYTVAIEQIVERIKRGTSKKLVEQIRKGNKELKNQLPAIVFSGLFNQRNGNGMETHSGLMCFDFDKYPSPEELKKQKEILKKNKHVLMLFVSPSGNGLKAVIKVSNELTKETHPQVFKAFNNQFKYDYFDIACSNLDRVCFESYDPSIYVNYEAVTFEAATFDEGFSYTSKVPLIPVDDENQIVSKIMAFDWKTDFIEGERNNFVFNLAGAFCEYGINESFAIGYIFNNVVYGKFSEKETETAVKSAYTIRDFSSKYFENYNKIDVVKRDLKNGKDYVIKKHKVDKNIVDKIEKDKNIKTFWFTDKKGAIKIDQFKYKSFLETNGFHKYFPKGTNKPTLIKITSNIVEETSIEKIKDFVLDNLISRGELDVWKLCVNYSILFSEQHLLMLETKDLITLRDTQYKSFIVYQNGILTVTKDKVKLIHFMDVDVYIWKNQIIPRKFIRSSNVENDYKKFIYNISNFNPKPFESVIGYLVNTYKNKSNNKAIILNDEVISDAPNGGTGKGVFTQGLRQIRRTSILDGKKFDDKDKFSYQSVSLDTQILVLDDVKKNFNFESKFSIVTEGLTIERKQKDAVVLGIEDSPKILISTNYVIKGDGNSHSRRRHEIEIGQYYGEKLTPFDDFGKQLFDDWNELEFISFDNYIISCIQLFLKEGLVGQTAKNLKLRKLIGETSKDFVDWISDDNLKFDIRIYKSDFFQKFTNENQDYNNKIFKRNTFNKWIQKYSAYKNYEFEQGSSNGIKWFSVVDTKKQDLKVKQLETLEI